MPLSDSVVCSTPGFPGLQYFPEFSQAHVHSVGDVIQSFCPLSFPSPPPLNLPSIRVFSNVLALEESGNSPCPDVHISTLDALIRESQRKVTCSLISGQCA